jgi:tetratricopeptide (TPR) repeat protein
MAGTFQRAKDLYQRGEYSEVIRLLEPQIFRFRESQEFYLLLGLSCLHAHDISAAYTYLQRGQDLSEHFEPDLMLGMAMVHLHRQENTEAVRCWLRVLEHDSKNSRAQRGLEFLRSEPKQERINDLLEEGKLEKLLPKTKKRVKIKKTVIIPLVILFMLSVSSIFFLPALRDFVARGETRDFQVLETNDFTELTSLTGSFHFILTAAEIEKSLSDINKYLLAYRDNLAMREINRILLSNAHQDVRIKVEGLIKNIRTPSFADFKDNFRYDEVAREPYLYRGCYVVWRGRATNIVIGDEEISFDFLVGYEDEKTLEGIVPVIVPFSADVTVNFPLEILARVVPVESRGFNLEVLSLHRLWD